MEMSRAATLVAPNRIEIREFPVPDIPPEGGLLAVELGGVCGTDVELYRGGIKRPLPLILGHEIVGRVANLGSKAASLHQVKEGDRVIIKATLGCGRCADCMRGAPRFCTEHVSYGFESSAEPPHLMGGFADYLYLRPETVMTKVSEDLSPEAAVIIGGVMVNGYQWAIKMGGVKGGDYVLVQGPGQQGLACVWASSRAGAARIFVTGTSKDHERLSMAKNFGADRVIDVDEEDPVEVVAAETRGAMADVVIDVSGSPSSIRGAVECVRRQGTIVLAGLTGDGTETPMLMDHLVWKEVRLQGAFVADNDAVEATVRLVESSTFPVEQMVTHVFSLAETERCIQAVGGEIPGLYPIKALIRP
jgi:alcohol dehydrogenase